MSKDSQDLHLMFECSSAQVANRVLFTLHGSYPSVVEEDIALQKVVTGLHSEGRFVFCSASGDAQEIYNLCVGYCRAHPTEVALVNLTPSAYPWDMYDIKKLQESDGELSYGVVYNNAWHRLLEDYIARVPFGELSTEQRQHVLERCNLGELNVCDSQLIMDVLSSYEGRSPDEETIRELHKDTEAIQCGLCSHSQRVDGTKTVWRMMVHLLLCYQYIS